MELYQLCSILEKISQVEDVRPVLAQFISNNTVNFEKAAQVLKGGKMTERSNSEPPNNGTKNSPSPSHKTGPVKVKQLYTQDERKQSKLSSQNDSKNSEQRHNGNQKLMTKTWMPNNKNLEDQFKKFTLMNQYKAMGLNNVSADMQKLLSNTLASYNPGGRNYMKEHKRSSKRHNRTRQHSANLKLNHSRRRKSPSRGRNEPNYNFFNLMKQSLRSSKSKHKKNNSSNNETLRSNSKRHNSKKSRASNTPKRGIRYSNMFARKSGSTRVSRKGSAANSNERGAYSTYISRKVSPKSKKKKASMDYEFSKTNSFSNMMMKEMRVRFNN